MLHILLADTQPSKPSPAINHRMKIRSRAVSVKPLLASTAREYLNDDAPFVLIRWLHLRQNLFHTTCI